MVQTQQPDWKLSSWIINESENVTWIIALQTLLPILSKSFINSEIVLVIIVQLLMMLCIELIIKLAKTDKYKSILIVKDKMEQT